MFLTRGFQGFLYLGELSNSESSPLQISKITYFFMLVIMNLEASYSKSLCIQMNILIPVCDNCCILSQTLYCFSLVHCGLSVLLGGLTCLLRTLRGFIRQQCLKLGTHILTTLECCVIFFPLFWVAWLKSKSPAGDW